MGDRFCNFVERLPAEDEDGLHVDINIGAGWHDCGDVRVEAIGEADAGGEALPAERELRVPWWRVQTRVSNSGCSAWPRPKSGEGEHDASSVGPACSASRSSRCSSW